MDTEINRKGVRAYVAMGSQRVTLQKMDAEDLEVEYEPLQEAFSEYALGSIEALGKAKVTLKVDHATAQVFIYIIPDEAQAVFLPASLPFTKQFCVTVV